MRKAAGSKDDADRLPESAGPGRLVVCEQTGRWAVALRRELAGRFRVHETRSVAQCWAALGEAPASFLIVALSGSNVELLLERMVWLERDFPLARVAVVAGDQLADYEWLVREAGAIYFARSPRRLGPLAELARRHLEQAPRPRRSFSQQIWAGLPWSE